MDNHQQLKGIFAGRRVLVTGHTGFKGSWLTAWLAMLGAKVTGVSLAPDQGPDNLFDRGKIADLCAAHNVLDIRQFDRLRDVFSEARPEIVFHLAAQALVIRSYHDPVGTFSTNVMGTVNVLEAARITNTVRALVCVTTDKVYDNADAPGPYKEIDRLGGSDAYSASKAAAEMAAATYGNSRSSAQPSYVLATARGGNVLGGGDWADNRIVPDVVRAIRRNEPLVLRNPHAVRPWQHVLDLNHGYMLLAARQLEGWPDRDKGSGDFGGAWNFGPGSEIEVTVAGLVDLVLRAWARESHPKEVKASSLAETDYLRLDSSKAMNDLGWHPKLAPDETVTWTARWYKKYLDGASADNLVSEQIEEYTSLDSGQDK